MIIFKSTYGHPLEQGICSPACLCLALSVMSIKIWSTLTFMEDSCCPLLLTCSASFLGVDAWFCYPGVFQRCWLSLSLPLTAATGRRGSPFLAQRGHTDQIAGLAVSAIQDMGASSYDTSQPLKVIMAFEGENFFPTYSSMSWVGFLTLFSWELVWFLQES